MGNKQNSFEKAVFLISDKDLEIRHQALEIARITVNKFLREKLGKENYFFKIFTYPHQIQRENPMAYGHKADRYGRGMSLSFGVPKHRAAKVSKGQKIMVVKVDEKNVSIAKQALKKASYKLPITYNFRIE